MNFVKSVVAVAVVGMALGATSASAERITTRHCIKAAGEVASAIDASQQSDNLKAAKAEQSAGSYFCRSGMFDKGVDHYNQALALLGKK